MLTEELVYCDDLWLMKLWMKFEIAKHDIIL